MVEVTQGVQKRWFKYDSLGRLLRVRQPEQEVNTALNLSDPFNTTGQWTAGFTYDVLGNVVRATDANGVNIVNEYDRANRVTKRCYTKPNINSTATNCAQISSNDQSTDTPTVTFWYDGKGLSTQQSPNYAKGKLTVVTNGISTTENMTFDNFGRLTRSKQITDGVEYGGGTDQTRWMTYTYNLSGALIEEQYPSGRKVRNDFESDGDLRRIFGTASVGTSERTYANAFSYTPDGKIEKLRLGNNLWESAEFNERLQVKALNLGHGPTSGSLWRLGYEYGELQTNGTVDTVKNTGNIARQTVSFNGLTHPFVQSYKYDSLYRLTEAKETKNGAQTWIQGFGYDRYGNRTSTSQTINGSTVNTTPAVDEYTNRFTSASFLFDKNGNQTRDVAPNSQSRTTVFNGDNKQTEVKDANGVTIGRYYYDGEGKRIKKKVYDGGIQTEETVFVYSSGKLIAEYSTTPAPQNPTTSYTVTDMLGSPRVLTNSLGEIISRRDFAPFGEELLPDGSNRSTNQQYVIDGLRKKFTGYEKDTETGLDFAENRMYENRYGRFTAVDPLLASGKSMNPQTFNRYVYVGNNPILRVDPLGLIWGVKDGRVRWFKDEKAMTKAGFAQSDEYYRTRAGNWIHLNPNGPNRERSGSWERNGWTFTEARNVPTEFNPENMPAATANNDVAENNSTRPGFLFGEFLSGSGDQNRYFGPNSTMTNQLRSSPDLGNDRRFFCSTACNGSSTYARDGSGAQFGLTGLKTFDQGILGQNGQDSHTRSVFENNETRAFVGSFSVRISEVNSTNRLTNFTVTNTTGAYSFFYHAVSDRNTNTSPIGNYGGYRDNNRPLFSNVTQTFQWSEVNPCGCRR